MSLEKKAEKLLESVEGLVNAVTGLVSELNNAPDDKAAAAAPPDKGDPKTKTTKKELAEIKKTAKMKAGSVLKALGKAKLVELFGAFDAKKFTDLKGDAYQFSAFIDAADEMIAAGKLDEGGDDDLLGTGDDEADKKEYTLEDVKAALLKVNNAEGLGREVTKQILADLGVARLGDLKADKFNEAVEKAGAALAGE